MTTSTSGMSKPRAATSVAISRGVCPDLKPSLAADRWFWLMSPWMAQGGSTTSPQSLSSSA